MKLQRIITTALLAMLSAASTLLAQAQELPIDSLKINQIQVLGTHNSYARPVDKELLALVSPLATHIYSNLAKQMSKEQLERFKEFHPNTVSFEEMLNYNHPPLTEQLDSGMRSLELDVYYDPQGGKFLNPEGYRLLREKGKVNLDYMETRGLAEPGFKVLHMADIDFRTYHPTFREALSTLKAWSAQNPKHVPLFIMVEAKDSGIPFLPHATSILPFDQSAFDQLDQDVFDIIGRENLIIPDDVRGNHATLNEAVRKGNWPKLADARGKFVFLLLPTTAGLGTYGGQYVKDAPNLEGKAMFANGSSTDSFGAFILMDNAKMRQEEIKQLVRDGFLVRTRSDIETYEAKVTDYSRAKAAFSSGAQVISTDFMKLPNPYGTSYQVKLPGAKEVRINPVNAK